MTMRLSQSYDRDEKVQLTENHGKAICRLLPKSGEQELQAAY